MKRLVPAVTVRANFPSWAVLKSDKQRSIMFWTSVQNVIHRCRHQKGLGHTCSLVLHRAFSTSLREKIIGPGDVHLWWMPLTTKLSEEKYDVCRQLLDPIVEVPKLDHAMNAEKKLVIESLVARAYLRHVLSQYSSICPVPSDITFIRNTHGKPEVRHCQSSQMTLHFNTTHTHGIVGVAVSCDRDIGIDVEARTRQTKKLDEMKLARRYFSNEEVRMLAALPPGDERRSRFVQLWTLKEAYVKALGRGIGASPGLKSFGFYLDTSQKYIEFIPSDKEPQFRTPWSFTLLEPIPGYIGAVCSEPYTKMTMHISPTLTSCSSLDQIYDETVQHISTSHRIVLASSLQ